MKLSRTAILDELEHQQSMIVALRKRLRILELQMAQHGSATPPQILTEIVSLTEQVQQHEAEVTKLETRAIENEMSSAEVEYRVLLAESWSAPHGRPTVVDQARLELARLRLGISLERAHHLEYAIRASLAQEVLHTINDGFYTDYLQGFSHSMTNEFWSIGRAIRLHIDAAMNHFHSLLPPKLCRPMPAFEETLLDVNDFWLYQQEYRTDFERFLTALPEELRRSDLRSTL